MAEMTVKEKYEQGLILFSALRQIRQGNQILVEAFYPEEQRWVHEMTITDNRDMVVECENCGAPGHWGANCPNTDDFGRLIEEPEPSIEDSPQYGDC